MGNALQIGSTSNECSQKDWQSFKAKISKIYTDLSIKTTSSADLKQDAQDLDTVCINFHSSKSPGFFQRLNTACSATGTEVLTYESSPASPASEPTNFLDFTDNISLWHSKVGVDWVRVGLSAGVLFLFLVVILLLMRRSSSAPRYGYA